MEDERVWVTRRRLQLTKLLAVPDAAVGLNWDRPVIQSTTKGRSVPGNLLYAGCSGSSTCVVVSNRRQATANAVSSLGGQLVGFLSLQSFLYTKDLRGNKSTSRYRVTFVQTAITSTVKLTRAKRIKRSGDAYTVTAQK